jgi:hypothetical protein
VKGCVDLRSFTLRCREFEKLEKLGLKSLAEAVLQRSLDKSPRLRQSDWEAEALTPEQMEYAANDALVAVDIFREVALKKVRGHRCLCGFCSTSLKLSPEFWRSSGGFDQSFFGIGPKGDDSVCMYVCPFVRPSVSLSVRTPHPRGLADLASA